MLWGVMFRVRLRGLGFGVLLAGGASSALGTQGAVIITYTILGGSFVTIIV